MDSGPRDEYVKWLEPYKGEAIHPELKKLYDAALKSKPGLFFKTTLVLTLPFAVAVFFSTNDWIIRALMVLLAIQVLRAFVSNDWSSLKQHRLLEYHAASWLYRHATPRDCTITLIKLGWDDPIFKSTQQVKVQSARDDLNGLDAFVYASGEEGLAKRLMDEQAGQELKARIFFEPEKCGKQCIFELQDKTGRLWCTADVRQVMQLHLTGNLIGDKTKVIKDHLDSLKRGGRR